MFTKILPFLALVAAISFSEIALAVDRCPVSDAQAEKAGGYVQAVITSVRNARNCRRAFKITEACQFGDSKTNQLLEIVESKCEPLFMTKASLATKRALERHKRAATRLPRETRGPCIIHSRLSAAPAQRAVLPTSLDIEHRRHLWDSTRYGLTRNSNWTLHDMRHNTFAKIVQQRMRHGISLPRALNHSQPAL